MTATKKAGTNDPSIKDIQLIFSVLTDAEKEYLEKNHRTVKYRKNQIIYQEGEMPTGLLCLGSGKVKIFKEGVGGRDQIVRLAKAPGLIGYRALFAGENHVASAVVIEPCTIFHINKEVVDNLMASNNKLCINIIKSFASELGFSRFRTVTLTQKHIRGRLAESLMLLKEIYGYEEDGCTLNIYLSREDLANFSNMTTSNAIRTLTTFMKEKLIAVDGRIIKILDEDMLERISRLG
ncbi:Crp/Fnr family transcriptional regulator [Natronoflexus pectinivorans]|uniref:CRP-like cAMP-binding protein n=1 Tax=Natronoflexus pectinivorans TaxID=682526 RepID=A0A4R2GHH1_9BACT|nr:Crp/Fnr family transcriptional regulator [Natronoflexus pectinivorans]TCO07674.1 CRP-like cAMP-binding protein [Natronoflexus pectinivorans]